MDDAARQVREMLGPAEPAEEPPPHQVVVHPGGVYVYAPGNGNTVIVCAVGSAREPTDSADS